MLKRLLMGAAPLLLAGFVSATPAAAQGDGAGLVAKAASEVQTMRADPQMRALLAHARGVLLVPEYGHGAFIIGGRGGEGVLLVRERGGRWSDPAFFGLGGISIGFQAGGDVGPVAYVLMSEGAVRQFENGNNFSLNAGAGLNVVTYHAGEHVDLTRGDVVVWSNTAGAFGGADVGATDVGYDGRLTSDFYGAPDVGIRQVIDGRVRNPQAAELRNAL
ncbi:MAG TPA: lipid-binding SYLF domain-containing protein [Rhizomicrobium sp.]|nr:lipid-binding SYLF domain-containing protein [Rhizomicrobium sp.]